MKRLILFISLVLPLLVFAKPALAMNSPPEILEFTGNTLNIITMIATAAAVFFLIRGGYLYITSTGNPEVLDQAKKTIRNAVIGLILVLGAGVIISIFNNALPGGGTSAGQSISMPAITTTKPTDGLTQVLIDADEAKIHVVVCDSRIGTSVFTPTIMSMIPTKICFTTATAESSLCILGSDLGVHLHGKGDMLLKEDGKEVIRLQAPYIEDKEIEKIIRKV